MPFWIAAAGLFAAVALVAADLRSAFVGQVEAGYRKATGLEPRVYVCRATNGAEIVA